MRKTVFRTATSFDGYIADEDQSLGWLFAVAQDDPDDHQTFLSEIGVLVEGSSTYEWVLRETDVLAHPEVWAQYYGSRPVFVFTSRDLPCPEGADVRFRRGPVTDHLAEMHAAAGAPHWAPSGGIPPRGAR